MPDSDHCQLVLDGLEEAASALDQFIQAEREDSQVAAAATRIAEALSKGHHIYSCGNGGSMCDAMHFAEELSGRFRHDRPALAATALSDPAHLTCVANDFGFDQVFSRSLEALGRPGDALLAISTSGSSPNILRAANAARQRQMFVIALTGSRENALAQLAHHHIACPAGRYSDRVQELHIKAIHLMIQLVEVMLYPKGLAPNTSPSP